MMSLLSLYKSEQICRQNHYCNSVYRNCAWDEVRRKECSNQHSAQIEMQVGSMINIHC